MAAAFISKPGTNFGPCKEKNCGHTDCKANRDTVETTCLLCLQPIGYETRYYRDDTYGLVHANCLEDMVDKARSA